jgi:hypothetical protein
MLRQTGANVAALGLYVTMMLAVVRPAWAETPMRW